MNRFRITPILLAAAVTIAGCEVGPNYQTPKFAVVPAVYSEATTRPTSQPADPQLAQVPTPDELKRWWETLHDPELNRLVDRALAANLDLQSAVQAIRQERAALGIAQAGLYPTIDVDGSYTHSRNSAHLGFGGSSGGTTGGRKLEGDLYQAGFDATWEIDVFGGVRRGDEAAQATLEAAMENRDAVMITLLGEVATDYVTLRGLQRQVAITHENISTQQQTMGLIESQNRAGLVADLDVTQQRAQLLTTQAELPDLEAQIHQTIHQLSILLALEPGALEEELETPAPIPLGPYHVPPGLPSELLRRRPDIRQAERNLASASAEIGVATADMFPKVSLTGSLGYESSQFHQLFDIYSRYFSIGPSVSWPIFDGGAILSNIEVQNALERQAFFTYESTVLTGLQEVDDALIAYSKEQDRRAELDEAVKADQRSVEMTQDLYKNGLDTFLDVLTAQNTLLAGEQQLTLSQQSVSTDLVALYKALGGGWEDYQNYQIPK
jgi:NodT family efflux transporter outer membrane factor (OMF) lipoprotein